MARDREQERVAKHQLPASSGNGIQKKKNKEKRIICGYGHERDIGPCGQKFNFFQQYLNHLKDVHAVMIEHEKKAFSNEEDFESWKKCVEEETSSQYVKDSKAKQQKNRDYVSRYYCHRSFYFRLHRKKDTDIPGKKKKNLGTNKLDFTCPAYFIRTSKPDGSIVIEFYKTHLGHDCEVARMRLHPDTRCAIAGKLHLGVPVPRILADLRNNSPSDFEEKEPLTRLHLTTKKDIRNVAVSFDVNNPIQKHIYDPVSVEMFCNKMKKLNENNPILLYKKQGESYSSPVLKDEDFVLIMSSKFQRKMLTKFGSKAICIDGTHGTNEYKFQLYTIVVLDEWDEAIPVAFAISNREDGEFFKIFFQSLKNEVGNICTELFMSDDASAFYNAWINIMEEPKQKLLCLWHVHKNWTTNQSKIKKEKRKVVMSSLCSIAEELDEEKFVKEFDNFIIQLENDPDTADFAAYIRRAYYNNMRSWARCFRKHVPIHTNMNLEAFHKNLKYDYLGGIKCARIDKLLYALLSVIRDKRFQREIKTLKKTPYKNMTKIVKSHLESANIGTDDIQVREDTYIVKNKYVICRRTNVTSACCRRICESCKICVHMYICSCRNNAVDFNICKHIHACAAKFFTPSVVTVQENDVFEIEQIELVSPDSDTGLALQLEADVPVQSMCLKNNLEIRDEIRSKNELIQGFINTLELPVDKGEEMLKLQDKIITLYHTYSTNPPGTKGKRRESRKLTKQSFYPTKKNSSKAKPKLPRMSSVAAESIQNTFLHGEQETINIHNEDDHLYHKL